MVFCTGKSALRAVEEAATVCIADYIFHLSEYAIAVVSTDGQTARTQFDSAEPTHPCGTAPHVQIPPGTVSFESSQAGMNGYGSAPVASQNPVPIRTGPTGGQQLLQGCTAHDHVVNPVGHDKAPSAAPAGRSVEVGVLTINCPNLTRA